MNSNTKFQLIGAGIIVAAHIYGQYLSRKTNRIIAEGQKKMAEQKFELLIPVPPQF